MIAVMYRVFLMICLVALAHTVQAQLTSTEPDKSPMDVCYSPNGYPVLKFQDKKTPPRPNARVLYSRPQKRGRVLFGTEVKYNEVWRLGANESTEIEFFANATFGGKKVAKGRYTMYCIPGAQSWTLILNKDLYSWGAFSYKPEMDVLRVPAPVAKNDQVMEYFTMYFDPNNNLVILWDDVKVQVPVVFSAK
jgi:hypothetical protein